ncbi:MAG: NAD-dependent epimerase/dehydratase family protein [Bacteroidia bacterium]|nr:NAD-dependent epimerase/dehydratase family protein [Bacteroidia bacterium]
MQTILGSGGAIGVGVAQALTAWTRDIRLVSRNPRKVNETDTLFPADLSDPQEIDRAVAGSEIVYVTIGFDYTAAIWRAKWPPFMRAVVAACEKHQAKLVFFDNVYMYDPAEIPHMTETSRIAPISQKGAVRAEIATMITDAVAAGRLTALIARSADFYGPGNDKSVLISTVYDNLRTGKPANWFISGDHLHTFTYTPDAAKATALLGNTPDAYNQVWHVPTDSTRLTGRDWVALFARELGVAPRLQTMPQWILSLVGIFVPILREFREMTYQYDRDYVFDSSKFEKRFGIKATPPEQAVREIVAAQPRG